MRTPIYFVIQRRYSRYEKCIKVSDNICKLKARIPLTSAIETGTQSHARPDFASEKLENAVLHIRAPYCVMLTNAWSALLLLSG